ncbi:MAG: protoglobin domain-containing protein [Vampirovibrionales bacterium]
MTNDTDNTHNTPHATAPAPNRLEPDDAAAGPAKAVLTQPGDGLVFTDSEAAVLREVEQVVQDEVNAILHQFMMSLTEHLPVNASDQADRLQKFGKMHKKHWLSLFDGTSGLDFSQQAWSLCQYYKSMGLSPEWYSRGFAFLLCRLIEHPATRKIDRLALSSAVMKAQGYALVLVNKKTELKLAATQAANDTALPNELDTSTLSELFSPEPSDPETADLDSATPMEDASDTPWEFRPHPSLDNPDASFADRFMDQVVSIEQRNVAVRHELEQISEALQRLLNASLDVFEVADEVDHDVGQIAMASAKLAHTIETVATNVSLLAQASSETRRMFNALATTALHSVRLSEDVMRAFGSLQANMNCLMQQANPVLDKERPTEAQLRELQNALERHLRPMVEAVNILGLVLDDVTESNQTMAAVVDRHRHTNDKLVLNMNDAAQVSQQVAERLTRFAMGVTSQAHRIRLMADTAKTVAEHLESHYFESKAMFRFSSETVLQSTEMTLTLAGLMGPKAPRDPEDHEVFDTDMESAHSEQRTS